MCKDCKNVYTSKKRDLTTHQTQQFKQSNSEYYQSSKKSLAEVILEKQRAPTSSNILDHFPDGFKPRQIQIDLLRQIQDRLSEGFRTILLSAPTGIGKSLIAGAIARNFGRSFVVTASKHLQDQYSHDLPFFKPVKGESNFACLKLMESKKIDFEETNFAIKHGLTCDIGPCDMKKTKGGQQILEKCNFKPSISEVESGKIPENSCFYYLQKYIGLVSPHTIWNYYSFFQMIKFQQKYFEDYLKRNVTIFDEAHRLEDQIIGFVGLDIYKGNLEECGVNAAHYDLSDIDMVVGLVDDLARSYARQAGQLLENRAFQMNPNYELLERLEKKHERFLHAKNEIKANAKNFVVNKPEKDENGGFASISVKPLDISKHLESFLTSPVRIFMSATIEPTSFCENTGIPVSEVAFIEAQKSPFLLENRKINFLNVKALNYATSNVDNLEVIRTIDSLLKIHENKRGLILTSSKERCYMIYNNLSDVNKKRIRICHSKNDDDLTVDEILEAHKADPRGVLLSSSLWEGIDLKDDLSRFQIIEKTPFPNLTEKWVKEKSAMYPLWYRSKTLMKLLQGLGRCLSDDTEILTKNGWKNIDTINNNDEVLSLDPRVFNVRTRVIYQRKPRLVWCKVLEIHKFENDSTMISISAKGVDSLVTPEHTMVIIPNKNRAKARLHSSRKNEMGSSYGLQKTKAEFLPNRFRLPVAGILNIKSSKRDSHWFELIGLIISDGYISKTKRSIDIYQSKSKPDVVKRIEYLISSLSLQHRRYFINNAGGAVFNYVRRNGIYCWRISGISAVKIHDFIFEGEFRRRYPIKNSTKKKFSVYKRDAAKVKIPWWMLQNATRKEKKSLLLGLMLGDGTWQTKNSGVYYTSDADLANFVQTLLVTLGYRSHLTHRTRSRLKPNYEISFSDNAWVEITTENISKVKYVGRTWCVTSEFGTIITRRNGKVLITGNSIRNDADWAKTYVLDSNASRLVSELKKFIPQAYHDALYLKT